MADAEEMACVELVEVVTDYLEGPLDGRARERFEAHLASCEGCVAYLDEICTTIVLSGELREWQPGPESTATLLRLVRDWHQISPG